MEKLIKLFESNSKKAMSEAEAHNSKRSWVKGERKETEAETWTEAARLLKKEQSRQADVGGSLLNDKHIEFGIRTFRNVQMASKVELILNPEHMNTVFTWKQVKDAIMNDATDR